MRIYNYLFYKSYVLAQRSKNFDDTPVLGGMIFVGACFMFNSFNCKQTMKNVITLIILILSYSMLPAQTKKVNPNPDVLIFKNQVKIKVYSSYDGNKVVNFIMNDTIKEDYFVMEILESRNNRYRINATSILFRGIRGWIDLKNIGINTRPRASKLHLYEKPDYHTNCLVVNEDEDNRIVKVVAVSSNWLKITWIDKKNYWLPPEYQCSNPYSTCN